jgi:hypothetical protein
LFGDSSFQLAIDVTGAIIVALGYFSIDTLVKTSITKEIVPGVTRWLESPFSETRIIGMVIPANVVNDDEITSINHQTPSDWD